MRDGFTWACEYGHTAVVELLLDRGLNVGELLPRPHGQTGLHWAAHAGHIEDSSFGETALGWALVGWPARKADGGTPKESFYRF
jgi:hypothetical protein